MLRGIKYFGDQNTDTFLLLEIKICDYFGPIDNQNRVQFFMTVYQDTVADYHEIFILGSYIIKDFSQLQLKLYNTGASNDYHVNHTQNCGELEDGDEFIIYLFITSLERRAWKAEDQNGIVNWNYSP